MTAISSREATAEEEPAGGRELPSPARDGGLSELRSVLVEPERAALEAVQRRLDDRERQAQELALNLASAVRRASGSRSLADALTPVLEQSVALSVQRRPAALADVISPVILPSIRRAVTQALRSMVESLNVILARSFSLESLGWRLTAWRTGQSFSEVALVRSLVFRVEQLFLIHRQGGLLLSHVASVEGGTTEPELVSGMLTAIRDFASESFEVGDNPSLEEVHIGEHELVIEQSGVLLLAALVRGTADPTLRDRLRQSLLEVRAAFGPELEGFRGDAAPFLGARQLLSECLVARQRPPRGGGWGWMALLGLVMLAVGGVAWWWKAQHDDWAPVIAALSREPGIQVLSYQRVGDRRALALLRDPDARDPELILGSAGLPRDQLETRMGYFYDEAPAFMQARAVRVLAPPPGVTLHLAGRGKLRVSGQAQAAWWAQAQARAAALPGVESLEAADLQLVERRALDESLRRITNHRVYFPIDSAVALEPQSVEDLVQEVEGADRWAQALGVQLEVSVLGGTDTTGGESHNRALALARAQGVATAFRARSLLATRIVTGAALDAQSVDGGAGALRSVQTSAREVPWPGKTP